MTRKRKAAEPEICFTCGKQIAREGQAGFFDTHLFQASFCACAALEERLMPASSGASGRSRKSSASDSLASFCQLCGLQSNSRASFGSITGFFSKNSQCKCRSEHGFAAEGMAERFLKIREAEADIVFASVTRDVLAEDRGAKTSIDLLPGALIGGIYRIVSLLGKGGMGEVYLARNIRLAKNCALKVIPPDQVTDTSWQRFQNEAKTIAGLDHINLVKVTDLGLHEGCLPFYAMEYLEGESLMERLKVCGRLPLSSVVDIFVQICDGLHYAHRKGIVHRDLKPANIMITKVSGQKFDVKILDFGLVKLTQKDRNQQSLTKFGEVFGTPFYMSPEQCSGGKVDTRSDIYSVGCTMFECLTGRVPFQGRSAIETITAHQSEPAPTLASVLGDALLPSSIEVVVANLLWKEPSERYQSLVDLKADLEAVARGEDVQPFYLRRQSLRVGDKRAGVFQLNDGHNVAIGTSGPGASKGKYALAAGLLLGTLALGAFLVGRAPARPTAIKVSSSSALSASSSSSSSSSECWLASARDQAAFSAVIKERGQEWRVFQFPADFAIGKIGPVGASALAARGPVKFPAASRLVFVPDAQIVRYPFYLSRFRQGDLWGVGLEGLLSRGDASGLNSALAALSKIPGVQELTLSGCSNFSKQDIIVLSRFKSLKRLDLGAPDINLEALLETPLPAALEEFCFSGYGDVSPLLKSLKHSATLKKLDLSASPVDGQGLADLASIVNLEVLHVDRFIPNDWSTSRAAVLALAKSPHLKMLLVNRLVVPSGDREAIKVLKKLKTIH